jgi:hypothetical protein
MPMERYMAKRALALVFRPFVCGSRRCMIKRLMALAGTVTARAFKPDSKGLA